MKDAIRQVTDELQARGYRLTRARRSIVDALYKAKHPQAIRALAAKVDADDASVYRTIDMLSAEGLVERIRLPDGSQAYALAFGHHHHLICTTCNRVLHIPCKGMRAKLPTHPDFANVEDHEVTYYGTCTACVA